MVAAEGTVAGTSARVMTTESLAGLHTMGAIVMVEQLDVDVVVRD